MLPDTRLIQNFSVEPIPEILTSAGNSYNEDGFFTKVMGMVSCGRGYPLNGTALALERSLGERAPFETQRYECGIRGWVG